MALRPVVPQAQTCLTAARDVASCVSGGTESGVAGHRRLMTGLATLSDVRKPRGVRHPYATVLTIALAAIIAGCSS
ncbi:MAG: transposase family protein [Thermaerobacter sp.]|nr:transposase family protein [Thermaerobacter sp.]